MLKEKFSLEFDKKPDLVFVQEKHGSVKVYQDGNLLKGVRGITIRAGIDGPTTHEIEYVTGCTSNE